MRANNLAQIVGVLIIVGDALTAFLLAQNDVAFDPMIKLGLGAASVVCTTLGLYLNVRMPGQSGPPA